MNQKKKLKQKQLKAENRQLKIKIAYLEKRLENK
jgi:hypothetical protein